MAGTAVSDDDIDNENITNPYENFELNIDLLCEKVKYVDGRMFINLENSCEITAVDEKVNKYFYLLLII